MRYRQYPCVLPLKVRGREWARARRRCRALHARCSTACSDDVSPQRCDCCGEVTLAEVVLQARERPSRTASLYRVSKIGYRPRMTSIDDDPQVRRGGGGAPGPGGDGGGTTGAAGAVPPRGGGPAPGGAVGGA